MGKIKDNICLVLAVVVIGAAVWIVYSASLSDQKFDLSDPSVLIGGIVVLLLVMSGVALIFKWTNLSNHQFAFALPQGSIRAILALGLLLIFVNIVVFLLAVVTAQEPKEIYVDGKIVSGDWSKLPKHVFVVKVAPEKTVQDREKKAVQASQKKINNGAENKSNEGQFYRLFYTSPDSPVRTDIAKQALTTLATVLVMVIGFYFGSRTSTQAAAAVGGATAESPPDGPQATRAKKLASAADAAADAAEVASKRAQAAIDRIQAAMSTEKNALKKKLLMTERGTAGDRQAAAQKAAVSARNAAKEADVAAEKAVADDPAPLLSSFMSRICSGYGPVGTGL